MPLTLRRAVVPSTADAPRSRHAAGKGKGKRVRYLWVAGVLALSMMCMLVGCSRTPLFGADDGGGGGAGGAGPARRLSSTSCPPKDQLMAGVTSDGGKVVVGFCIILYCFVGLAMVCDDYFEPALGVISERLGLTPDVAGATFLAAGSSAPELFTSVGDAFGPANSIGMGTIVGSAMFNILVIVALSAAVAGGELHIDWRPVSRDVTFYCSSIVMLAIFFDDGVVNFAEALVMVLGYVVYVLFMKFNSRVLGKCGKRPPACLGGGGKGAGGAKVQPEEEAANAAAAAAAVASLSKNLPAAEGLPQLSPQGAAALAPLNDSIVVRAKSALDLEAEAQKAQEGGEGPGGEGGGGGGAVVAAGGDDDDDDEGGKFDVPDSLAGKLWFAFVFPYTGGFHVSIPECEEEEAQKYCYVAFFMCIVWIGALCFLMVMAATEVGCVLNVSPTLMGILVLSIGTSVPDAIGSMIASRKGEADMAVANAIGSNVFDILLGLGLPWMLRAVIEGEDTVVDKNGIKESVGILFGTVWLFLGVLVFNRWKMTKQLGLMLFFLYVIYVAYNIAKAATEDTTPGAV